MGALAEETAKRKDPRNNLRRAYKVFSNVLFACALALLAILVFSLVTSAIAGGPPTILGHRMYIVMSGSMSPALGIGSLTFVRPTAPGNIKEGDIITYRGLGEEAQLVSHRVVKINNVDGDISFTTKGDANEAQDPNPVTASHLVGRVALAIPYLGYLLHYVKTKQAIMPVILLSVVLLLLSEGAGIYKGLRAKGKGKKPGNEGEGNRGS